MTRLPLILGTSVAALAFASLTGTAKADTVDTGRGVHFSGGVHWSGGVHVGGSSVHWSRPAYSSWRPNSWHVSGHVYVGGYRPYVYRPYYYYYYPQYVPSYYGESYYPVQPTYAAPGVTTAVVVTPELPKFGIGLFAGGVSTDYNTQTNTQESDIGILGRYRLTPGLLIEGELGKSATSVDGVDNVRVDRRLGGSLLYEIGAYNRWAPYVLAGLGVQQSDVSGDYATTQDFGEIGAGIRFAVSSHFHLTLDLRAGTRSTVSNDPVMTTTGVARTITPPTSDSGQSEDYVRGRLSAILYF